MKRREWYWERQGRRCYLAATPECRTQGGVLKSFTGATWEHVLPKARYPKGIPHLKLLACHWCNTAKGSAEPSLEQVEYALALSREWLTRTGQMHGLGLKKLEAVCAAWMARRKAYDAEQEMLAAELEVLLAKTAAA